MARSTREVAIDPPYDEVFRGVLSFKTFTDAERTLQRLEDLRLKYTAAGDGKGCGYCRQVGLAGRERAERISRDRRVNDRRRLQKREVASWFQVWLETPEIFRDWLLLRKGSPSFKKLAEEVGDESAPEGALPDGKER